VLFPLAHISLPSGTPISIPSAFPLPYRTSYKMHNRSKCISCSPFVLLTHFSLKMNEDVQRERERKALPDKIMLKSSETGSGQPSEYN
jgi:hypothetical protein